MAQLAAGQANVFQLEIVEAIERGSGAEHSLPVGEAARRAAALLEG